MALFRHPCLVRGIVHTPYGAFTVVRGFVELPDEIGVALGWPRYGEETSSSPSRPLRGSSEQLYAMPADTR